MNVVIVVALMSLNFAISFWNAYMCGMQMSAAKQAGGAAKIMMWSGLTMSACGFTWVYLVVFSVLGMYTPDFIGIHGEEVKGAMLVTKDMAEAVMAAGYLVIILPIIGSGLAIWVESIVDAWKRRTFGSIARAGWNTFAQANNIYGAVNGIPSAWETVGKLLKGDGKKNALFVVVILTIVAVLSGILTTASIARWADRKNFKE